MHHSVHVRPGTFLTEIGFFFTQSSGEVPMAEWSNALGGHPGIRGSNPTAVLGMKLFRQ